MHEPGDKRLLGHRIKDGGESEGIQALMLLAKSPATAHFICRKIAIRFVSDDPPQSLVDRMAKTFLRRDGDIREVLRTLYKSQEFWASNEYRAKAKTPLEFVVSAVRMSGATVTNAQSLVRVLNGMGMPLYGMQPPTGYSMTKDAWINSSALLARFNFSLALAAGRIPGVSVDATRLVNGSSDVVGQLQSTLLNGDLSPQTRLAIQKELDEPQLAFNAVRMNSSEEFTGGDRAWFKRGAKGLPKAGSPPSKEALALGLMLGSPEFQRR